MVDHLADDFARADSTTTLGSTSTGAGAWAPDNGVWGIDTGQAYRVSGVGGKNVALLATSTPEGKVAADLTIPAVTYYVGGVAARGSDAAHHWRGVIDSSAATLGYFDGGGWIEVYNSGPSVYPSSATYRLELTCRGTTIEFRIDGTLVHTEVSSVHAGLTGFGLAGDTYVSSGNLRWDDFDLELPQEASVTFDGAGSFTADGLIVEYPATVVGPRSLVGPSAAFGDVTSARPGTLVGPRSVPGMVAPIPAEMVGPMTPMSLVGPRRVPGPRALRHRAGPLPNYPVIQLASTGDGTYYVDARFKVTETSNATDISCDPVINEVGTGRFTMQPPAPALDTAVGFEVAGERIFTGIVDDTDEVLAGSGTGEDAEKLVTVSCLGQVSELDRMRVLPDFGAQDIARLGPPTQDTRVFDWTMNGLGNELFGEQAATIIPSSSLGVVEADALELFDPPDVWCDGDARWMWLGQPGNQAPAGWYHFRVPTPIRGGIRRCQFWLCSTYYAELWVDGVPLLTCKRKSESQHIELEDIRDDYHLVTIKAYTPGGPSGVLFSMVEVDETSGMFISPPLMNSRSNWKSIRGSNNTTGIRTFISTPGQVMNRLFYEARRRNVDHASEWQMSFGNLIDSAGRAWDREFAIEVAVGLSYLDVCRQLAESAWDWAEDAGSKTLHAWRKGEGSGRSSPMPFDVAVDAKSAGRKIASRT